MPFGNRSPDYTYDIVQKLGGSEVQRMSATALAARVAQSSIHLISTTNLAVNIRFAFFAVQLVIAALWVIQLLVQGPAA